MLRAQSNMDRNWITPPKVIVRKGQKNDPQKLSYWIDEKGKRHLYTKEELAICNVLTNLNLVLIRALILLDTLEKIDRNAKVKKLISQDYTKYNATKSSIFNRFITLMATAPDITFGEFLGFISGNSDPQTIVKMGQKTLKKSGVDIFYTSDLFEKK